MAEIQRMWMELRVKKTERVDLSSFWYLEKTCFSEVLRRGSPGPGKGSDDSFDSEAGGTKE